MTTPEIPMTPDLKTPRVLEHLRERVLTKHGGTSDPWQHQWNLTDPDSLLHKEAAAEIERLMKDPSSVLSEYPGCCYCMEAGTPVKSGEVCPQCGDRLPTARERQLESELTTLTQRLEGVTAEWNAEREVMMNGARMLARFAKPHAERENEDSPSHNTSELVHHIQHILSIPPNQRTVTWMTEWTKRVESSTTLVTSLTEALREVLDAREAEAKAQLTLGTASDNFSSGFKVELAAYEAAFIRTSKAEKDARKLVALPDEKETK